MKDILGWVSKIVLEVTTTWSLQRDKTLGEESGLEKASDSPLIKLNTTGRTGRAYGKAGNLKLIEVVAMPRIHRHEREVQNFAHMIINAMRSLSSTSCQFNLPTLLVRQHLSINSFPHTCNCSNPHNHWLRTIEAVSVHMYNHRPRGHSHHHSRVRSHVVLGRLYHWEAFSRPESSPNEDYRLEMTTLIVAYVEAIATQRHAIGKRVMS